MTYRITVDLAPIGIAYEVGSLPEGLGILVDEKATLINIAAIGNEILNPVEAAAPNGTADVDKPKGKRGRPSKEEIAARAAASSPPPVPVPTAPVDMTPDPVTGIPAGLKRDGIAPPTFVAPAPAPVAPAPAPVAVAPVPPPPAPAAPSELADKVIARLRDLKAASPDGGAAYAAWLTNPDPAQGYGVAKQGTDFDSVLSILRFKDEPLLQRIASALGVL